MLNFPPKADREWRVILPNDRRVIPGRRRDFSRFSDMDRDVTLTGFLLALRFLLSRERENDNSAGAYTCCDLLGLTISVEAGSRSETQM